MTVHSRIEATRPRTLTKSIHAQGVTARLRMVVAAILALACTLSPTAAQATPTSLTSDGLAHADLASCVIVGDLSNYHFQTNDASLFVDRPGVKYVYFRYTPAGGVNRLGADKWFQLDYPNAVLDTNGCYHDLHIRFGNVQARWGQNPALGLIYQRMVTCYADRLSIDVKHTWTFDDSFASVSSNASANTYAGLRADISIWAGNEQDDPTLTYNLYVTDLDVRDFFTNDYTGDWSESISLGSMFDTIHVEQNTYLRMRNGRIYGSQTDTNTHRSGFVSLGTMSAAAPLSFAWAASEAGTTLLDNWSHVITAKATTGGTVAIGTGSGTMLETPIEEIEDGDYRTQTRLEAVPGNDYLVTATPSYGYDIGDLSLDGASLGATDAVSIPAIAADHTVCATFVPRRGRLALEKASTNSDITDQNPCYILEGATYGLYADEACTELVETLVTDEHGVTEAVELPIGAYWLRETTAPAGYAIDPDAHQVEVVVGTTTTVPLADEPLADPIELLVQKVDAQTGAAEGQGSTTLAGAEFLVCFYAGWFEAEALPVAPTRAWVFVTDADGSSYLDDEHLLSGDALYRDGDGRPVLPLGTIVLAETKAPSGYRLPSDVQPVVQHLGLDAEQAAIRGYAEPTEAEPTVADEVVRGGLAVRKVDERGEGLAGARFSVINRSERAVVVGDATFAPGETCLTLTSNDEGVAASAPQALPPGSYEVREHEAPRGYHLDGDWSVDATIPVDGGVVDLTDEPLQDARKAVDVDLVATKTFDGSSQGRELEAGQFSFELCATDGTVLQTKTNDETGTVHFDPLTFDYRDLEISHEYQVREVNGGDPEIVYDSHIENVRIDLREEENGLVADVVTDDDGIAFANRTVRTVELPLTGLGGSRIGWMGTLLTLVTGAATLSRRRGRHS